VHSSGKDPDPKSKANEMPGEDEQSTAAVKNYTNAYDRAQWETYLKEIMSDFPLPEISSESLMDDPPIEPDGTGVNKKVYYVCSDLGDEWVRLPSITPQQVNTSRLIRWLLTGELDGKIRTLPPFPGQEGHYLRSLLARITCGAVVSPKGYFKGSGRFIDEYEGEDDEEFDSEDDESAAR